MNVKMFFIMQDMCLAEIITDNGVEFTIKNPVLISQKGAQEMMMIPLLVLCEEDTATVQYSNVLFNTLFTPKKEIVNHYNRLFGSGIVVPNNGNILQF